VMLSVRAADVFDAKAVNNQRECYGSCRMGEKTGSVIGPYSARCLTSHSLAMITAIFWKAGLHCTCICEFHKSEEEE
jgi:hypothetical protein